MGDIIITLSVANTLLTALNHPLLKDAFLSFAYGNRLKKLKGTVSTVKSLLLDAANKSELSEVDRNYIEKLKDAVYDADDLFDRLVTQAERKQLFGDDSIIEKVCQLLPSVKTSLKVKKLRLRLKDIGDHAKFGLSIDTKPHRNLRVETFSYVAAPTIVGRDVDSRIVITKLLDSKKHVNLLTIVGTGGVGKTTLAKLVFGDERIQSVFNLRLWVCVSDQDGASLDVKDILVKILELLNCKRDSSSSIESLHGEYLRKVGGKRVLLVLDDVWSESTVELNRLKELLMIEGSGNRIIATTRSMKTARIVGDCIHELQGLSDYHSRQLFEMAAFGSALKPIDFVEIVKKIVHICSNIPLVIKVVGSLLHGLPLGKWQTFVTSGFAEFTKEENDIMSILKLSYDHLDPSVKSCFAYCAIFPKDYVICKEVLMDLWKAQGYIVPFREGQGVEAAGEEHFSILLQRCFFQDVERDEDGDVLAFKIHDLMHDLAQRVSGNEIYVTNSSMTELKGNVRHLFVDGLHHLLCKGPINTDDLNLKSKIRSYLTFRNSWHDERGYELQPFEIPNNWECLRALALGNMKIRLPDTIGNLLHLRYLNLAYSKIKELPDSIVRLNNLQSLNLRYCKFFEKWPKDFSKLVNLTHLDTEACLRLSYMPVGMSNLSHLRTLTQFVVNDESTSGMQRVAQLTDLKALAANLRGRIRIRFKADFKGAERYDWEGSFFEHAEHLNEVEIRFHFGAKLIDAQIVMEKLKPHRNLRKFSFSNFKVNKIARWGSAKDNWATFFPNLVNISLYLCHQVQELPMLSKLQHLKTLSLLNFENLEYIEEEVTSSSGSGSFDTTFFPSLEFLHIHHLQNLKSWRRPGDCSESHCQPAFPILSNLSIRHCCRLESFPHCLSRPEVNLIKCNKVVITAADEVHTSPS